MNVKGGATGRRIARGKPLDVGLRSDARPLSAASLRGQPPEGAAPYQAADWSAPRPAGARSRRGASSCPTVSDERPVSYPRRSAPAVSRRRASWSSPAAAIESRSARSGLFG